MKRGMRLTPKSKVGLNTTIKYTAIAGSFSVILFISFLIYNNIGNVADVKAESTPLPDYEWRQEITIEAKTIRGNKNLIDYNLLIELSDDDLKSYANGGKVAHINGSDIKFTKSDEFTELKYTIVNYNPETGDLTARIMFDTIYAKKNTTAYLYSGNINDTTLNPQDLKPQWNSDYVGVWNFDDDHNDASNISHSATNKGVAYTPSILGKGLDFKGNGEFINIADHNSLDLTTEGTISAWIYLDSYVNFSGIIHKGDKTDYSDEAYSLQLWNNDKIRFQLFGKNASKAINSKKIKPKTWYHVIAKWNNEKMYLYVNGKLQSSAKHKLTVRNTTGGVNIGALFTESFSRSFSNFPFKGIIDEVRFLKRAITKNEVRNIYNLQHSPSSFFKASPTQSMAESLPIELTSFSAVLLDDHTILLNWGTATEIDNDFFTIERSTDGVNFKVLTTVAGAGNSNNIIYYKEIDVNPLAGISYYRLKQTDYDGQYEYFNIIAIENGKAEQILLEITSVYPNPFMSQFTLQYNTPSEEPVYVYIFNINGQIAYKNAITPTSELNEYTFSDFGNIPNGQYFMSIVQENQTSESIKLIKQ